MTLCKAMMNEWDDEGDHRSALTGLRIGDSQLGDLELPRYTPDETESSSIHDDNHIYEDRLDTTASGTETRGSRAGGNISPAQSPDRHLHVDVSLDQTPLRSYQNSAPDSKPIPDSGLGLSQNPLDNTDAPSIGSWEEDHDGDGGIVTVDPPNLSDFENHHHDHHDELAERIAHLTRTINAHASTCLEVSSRAVELARENSHLATQAGGVLSAYVLRPCLRLVGSSSASAMQMLMRTYGGAGDSPKGLKNERSDRAVGSEGGMQAIRRECEDRLRRALANCKNGRDMAMIGQTGAGVGMGIRGGLGGNEREVSRLKDRLVEQDAVLRDSSRHIRRLMWERDGLRKELESGHHKRNGSHQRTKIDKASDFEETIVRGSTPMALAKMRAREMAATPEDNPYGGKNGVHDEEDEEARNRERQLTAQLEELRVLMDRMALHDISNPDHGHGQRPKSSSSASASALSSSFFSAPEEEERVEAKTGGSRQQKQGPPPPSLDLGDDADDPEWTLL